MNHDEILKNRAVPATNSEHTSDEDGEELVFALKDNFHAFSLDMETLLHCLQMAEKEGVVPEIPGDWWLDVSRHHNIRTLSRGS